LTAIQKREELWQQKRWFLSYRNRTGLRRLAEPDAVEAGQLVNQIQKWDYEAKSSCSASGQPGS
jgi:hypothetical protein